MCQNNKNIIDPMRMTAMCNFKSPINSICKTENENVLDSLVPIQSSVSKIAIGDFDLNI